MKMAQEQPSLFVSLEIKIEKTPPAQMCPLMKSCASDGIIGRTPSDPETIKSYHEKLQSLETFDPEIAKSIEDNCNIVRHVHVELIILNLFNQGEFSFFGVIHTLVVVSPRATFATATS